VSHFTRPEPTVTANAEIVIDITNPDTPTTTTSPTPELVVTPQFCPLLGGHLLLRVELVSPAKESPLPPAWAVVAPFTPDEGLAYLTEMDRYEGKPAERIAEQRKRLAPQIREWNFSITGSEPVPINPGTLSRIPTWALNKIELAVFAEAGKLLGN